MAAGATVSELLFTISLFSGMLLVVSPLIHKKLQASEPAQWHRPLLRTVDWAPFAFAFLAWGLDFIAFMTLDFESARVAAILPENANFFHRISGALHGWTSITMAFLLGFSLYFAYVLSSIQHLTTFESSEMEKADYIRLSHNLRRWGGWMWILALYGLMPNDPFPLGDGISSGGIELARLGQNAAMWVAMLLFGLMTGIGVLQLALLMERADRFHDSEYFPNIIGWLLTIPAASFLLVLFFQGTFSSYDPMGMLLLDPLFDKRIAFFFAMGLMFLYGTTALRAHIISEQRLRVGSQRWKGLAGGIGHHVFIVWLSTIMLARQLPNVENLLGAVWLGTMLVIPGFIAGLLGMLLPIAGLDDRPRPEFWGFRILQALSLPFIAAWMPLAILTAPGILIGVSTSAIIAPICEDNPRVGNRFRFDTKRTVIIADLIFLLLVIYPPAAIGMVVAFAFASFVATLPLRMVKRVRPS
ncbi:MAG: hypothetical protein QF817_04280 [Candidatus Poseidoniaceae archaeon]|jgi:hypothetical protein|nr:hypothetical protein [Candidatus Poseidoniaceae archaeon]